MPWLIPSVIATAAGTAILTACFTYVYFLDQRKYLKVWAISWGVYFLRFALFLISLLWQKEPFLLIGNQMASLISGVLLLYGTYLFIDRPFPRVILYLSVLDSLWIFISILNDYPFFLITLPTFAFLSYVYIWTGLMFFKSPSMEKKESALVGTGFILWGIHKADYPFLHPVAWFAPWGYLMAAVIEFTVAMGLLLTYFRKIRNELALSEEKYRTVFHNSPDSISLIRAKDGIFIDINEGFTKTMGYSRQEVIGKSPMALSLWDDPIYGERIDSELQSYGVVKNREVFFRSKGGRVLAGLMTAKAIDLKNEAIIFSIIRDITDRRQIEADRERWLTAIEQAVDGIMITDAHGIIEYINPSFEKISGYPVRELKGRSPNVLKSGKQDDEFYGRMWKTINSGMKWNGLIINKKKSGELYTEEMTISPVFDPSGGITNFVAVKRDITDEIKLKERLQQSQKMEAIGTLAGGIAHDFNNILVPIMGHAEILLEDMQQDSPFRSSLDQIYSSAVRAKDLVHQILAFARQEKSELKLLKLPPIIKESLKLIRSTIPATIAIRQNLQADCSPVTADSIQIHQIIMNLATNAFHAMEKDGGELHVGLSEVKLSREDRIYPDMAVGRYACLSVSDTGVGMDKDMVKRIFDPFFTTKSQGKGTGMGLAVVHGIVTAMKGAIRVFSEPGKGTRFDVFLPVVPRAGEDKALPNDDEPLPRGTETILLVDDEEAVVALEKQILERLGYHVVSRTSSTEALEAFRSKPGKYDLIITDMAMPNLPGDKLALELIRVRADIPILICTGFSESMTEERIRHLGIRGSVLKPILIKDLAKKIREVLDSGKKDHSKGEPENEQ